MMKSKSGKLVYVNRDMEIIINNNTRQMTPSILNLTLFGVLKN